MLSVTAQIIKVSLYGNLTNILLEIESGLKMPYLVSLLNYLSLFGDLATWERFHRVLVLLISLSLELSDPSVIHVH